MATDPVKPNPQRLVRAALNLAKTNIPVFPCVPGGKRPLTPHGYLDATTNPIQISAWWESTPTANVAIITGEQTFDILDVDVRPSGSGYPALHRITEAGLTQQHRLEITTPSGGRHLYFRGSQQLSGRLANHNLDFKATGGYVLVPPSVVNGASYMVTHRDMNQRNGVLNWQAVRDLLDPVGPPPKPGLGVSRQKLDIKALSAWVSRLPEGHRNSGLFWASCRAAEYGIEDLSPLVNAAVHAGLDQREATRTVASALQRVSGTGPSQYRLPRPRGSSGPEPPRFPRPRRGR